MELRKDEYIVDTKPDFCWNCKNSTYRSAYPVGYETEFGSGVIMVSFHPWCMDTHCGGENALVHNKRTNEVFLVCRSCGSRIAWAKVAGAIEEG